MQEIKLAHFIFICSLFDQFQLLLYEYDVLVQFKMFLKSYFFIGHIFNRVPSSIPSIRVPQKQCCFDLEQHPGRRVPGARCPINFLVDAEAFLALGRGVP